MAVLTWETGAAGNQVYPGTVSGWWKELFALSPQGRNWLQLCWCLWQNVGRKCPPGGASKKLVHG